MLSQTTHRRFKTALIIIAITAILWLFFKYVLTLLLPFFIAWGIALAVQPIVKSIAAKTPMPRAFICVSVLILIFSILALLIFLIVDRLIFELLGLSNYLENNSTSIINFARTFFAWAEKMILSIPLFSQNGGAMVDFDELARLVKASIKPISDIRASAEYRSDLAAALIAKLVKAAV